MSSNQDQGMMTPPATQGLLDVMQPTNKQEVLWLCQTLAKSDLVPKDFRGKWENVYICVWHGARLGYDPFSSLQNISVINGRPQIWGDEPLARVQRHPDYQGHEEDDLADIAKKGSATCIVRRRGNKPMKVTYTVENAKKQDLWGKAGPWRQIPERMLQLRARSFALRNQFADALRGIVIKEDMEGVKDVQTGELHPRPSADTVVDAMAGAGPSQDDMLADALRGIEVASSAEELSRMAQHVKTLPPAVANGCRNAYVAKQKELGVVAPQSKAERLLEDRRKAKQQEGLPNV